MLQKIIEITRWINDIYINALIFMGFAQSEFYIQCKINRVNLIDCILSRNYTIFTFLSNGRKSMLRYRIC